MIARFSLVTALCASLVVHLCAGALCSPPASAYLTEDFAYTNGNLAGKGSWAGSAGSEIYVTSQTVRITGGSSTTDAYRTVSYAGSGSVIWVHFKAMTGTGGGGIMWGLWLDDSTASYNNLARFYGAANTCRGRIGGTGTVTDLHDLTPSIWNDLDVRIDTAANTCEFYCNRFYMGKLDHGATPNNTLGRIRFDRVGNDSAAGNTIFFDELRVGSQPAGTPCDPPAAPAITSPTPGEPVQTQTPTIQWTGNPHDSYEVHVNSVNSPGSGMVWDSGEVASAANNCTSGTLAAGSYHAFARIKNPAGWGPWSASVAFQVVVAARILPVPQESTWDFGSHFSVDANTRIVMNDSTDEKDLFIARQLRRKVWDMTGHLPQIVKGVAGAPTTNVIAIGDPAQNSAVASILVDWPQAMGKVSKSEGYILGIKGDSVLVRGFDQKGTFYGCQTLILLLEQYSAAPIDGLFCYDYPDMGWRGTFVRVWHDRDWDFAKEVLSEVMARYKMNVLEPDITMTSDAHPEIPLTYGEPVPIAAALDYVAFARQCFMEIIGCGGAGYQGSDGSVTYGTLHADLREDQSVPDESGPENLCPQNPAAIQLVNECRQEYIDLFHPAYMQIGQSEYSVMRATSCPRCGGMSNLDWYVMCLTIDANYYASKGITPIMWGDMLRQDMPAGASWGTWQCVPSVPKSIIIQDWDYSTKTDFPSLATWNANGLTSLGAPYGYGMSGYVGKQNIYYWGKSCKSYGNRGLVAFNKYRTLYKEETISNPVWLGNMACFPFYAEWSWSAERPYWDPDPYSGQQMILDRISPDRPSSFTATKVGDNVQLAWTNPPEAKFQGTYLCYRLDTYPTDPTDAVFVADVAGSPNGSGSFTHTSVPLGATVYYSAFSHDAVRHFSATARANVANGSPLSLNSLGTYPDSKALNVGQCIVTAVYQNCFYVEDANRLSGIRVESTEPVSVGSIVTINGLLGKTGMERSFAALSFAVTGQNTPALTPLALSNRAVGGADRGYVPGALGGVGANNVGLLVKAFGRVQDVDPGGGFFYVNDGSSPNGIKVRLTGGLSPMSVPAGTYVLVTGACCLDSDGAPMIWPRSQADIRAVL